LDGTRVSKTITHVPGNVNHIDVTIRLDTNPGIFSFMTNLVFDNTKLTPVSIEDGFDLYDFGITLPEVEGGRFPNRLIFAAVSPEITNETGALATVRFRINGQINHALPIAIEHLNLSVSDGNGGVKSISTSTGSRTLSQFGILSNDNELDTIKIRVGPGIPWGDVNDDGWLCIADATLFARRLIGQSSPGFNARVADVDLDGQVTLADLVLLTRFLVGQRVALGIPYLDMSYRIFVSTVGGPTINEANAIINDIRPGFRNVLNTTLTMGQSGVATSDLNVRDGCTGALGQCFTWNCGSICFVNEPSHLSHHRSAKYYLELNSLKSNNINTFRFVGHVICYDCPTRGHGSVNGLASHAGGRDMIVTMRAPNREYTTAHEISHLLGATHSIPCNIGQPCVMREGIFPVVLNEWCTNCKRAIASQR